LAGFARENSTSRYFHESLKTIIVRFAICAAKNAADALESKDHPVQLPEADMADAITRRWKSS
jgi:hypothetical protein